MVHYLFMTRGAKRDVDEMAKFLETASFILPYVDMADGGKIKGQPLTGILQPIQLWSYVVPDKALDVVLNSLGADEENINRWQGNLKMKAMVKGLQVAMGAEKIPEFKKDQKMYLPMPSMENISIIPIGIKRDVVVREQDGKIHEAI